MKLSSVITLCLASVAYANIKCYCTKDQSQLGDPDVTSNTCCVSGDGITFPDGKDRKGTWSADKQCILQTNGLGYPLNSYISAYAACCRSTGPQTGYKYGGNCYSI
ncbi:uncharacterized protein CTRU02_206742 [Colletotrichum truncatum]|uniref:Uncharacterized protein n=1 Tax=Colletotrichum truncatum TaxID=5467 RepID=A0ACC3Z7Q6_COLTU|nr:uncharacterized protein CTRU02_14164 [Colletotrichum truncatum]KAF6782517.1 hypothetical protein CTRU02_14164 [Colletotrichum truncatum]